MIDEFLDLANEIGLKNEKKLRKKFKGYDVSESNLIKQLEEELSNNLFTYEFFSGILEKDSKLGSSFVIHSADGYEYIKYSSGVYYSKSSNIDISEYVGFRFFVLKEVVNVVPVDDMIREIVDLTPLWSALLLVLTPFVLLTPLYVNIFNTRLVYSNSAITLLFVSIFFAMTLMLEFTVKKYIKDKSLKSNAKSAVKLERYFLKFIPYYSGISAVHSMKTIEQYRKNLWDMIPSIAVECTTFLILFVALTTFISWLSVYFFLFYATVFIIFYIYRTRLYKYLLKLESASNHVLNMRVLNVMSRINIPFINNKYLYDRYVNKYGIALNCEDRIARFNFYWDELTKIISFFSLFILFLVSFYSISNSQLNPSYMTVLFILSSRLSGSISQMVTRLSYYNISVHHIKESFSSLINDDVIKLEKIDKVGIQLQTIKKIKVQDLTLTTKSLDKLITGGSAKFHRGGIYGIKGKVGSGKSTFLRALVGIESIEKGKIEYDGVDINILDSSFFKNHVSYVSASDNQLFPGSLYENFVYRNCNTKRIMDTILSECFGERVFDYQSLYVDDIETIAMSTGQKRKLIFLLSLLDQSKLYIFDEVLVNLPKEDIEKSISIMRQFSRDSIIILASHSDAILNACDLVYEINEGTIDVGR